MQQFVNMNNAMERRSLARVDPAATWGHSAEPADRPARLPRRQHRHPRTPSLAAGAAGYFDSQFAQEAAGQDAYGHHYEAFQKLIGGR